MCYVGNIDRQTSSESQMTSPSEQSRGSRKPSTKATGSTAVKTHNGANVNVSFDRNESMVGGRPKKAIKPSSAARQTSTASDNLLIDFAPSSPPIVGLGGGVAKGASTQQLSPIDLMQNSVAEKYACLPPPVTEDPAYRKTSASQSYSGGAAYLPKRPPLVGQESPRLAMSMSLKGGATNSVSKTLPLTTTNTVSTAQTTRGGIYYSCPPVEEYSTAG